MKSKLAFPKPSKKSKIKKTSPKALKKQCDTRWSLTIKERDPICVCCNLRPSINAHHIISRGVISTRHLLINGVGLCGGCHRLAHQHPYKFAEKMGDKFKTRLSLLKITAYDAGFKKANYEHRLEHLNAIAELIEKAKHNEDRHAIHNNYCPDCGNWNQFVLPGIPSDNENKV